MLHSVGCDRRGQGERIVLFGLRGEDEAGHVDGIFSGKPLTIECVLYVALQERLLANREVMNV